MAQPAFSYNDPNMQQGFSAQPAGYPPPPGYAGPNAYGQPPTYGQAVIYPPTPGAPLQPGQPMVVMQEGQTGAIFAMMLSRVPVQVPCPHCNTTVTTEVETEVGKMSWFWCFFCCFMGCLCLMWLPFVMDMFKDAVHRCPQCHNELGRSQACAGSGGGRRRRRGRRIGRRR